MYYYAELNEELICIAVKIVFEPIIREDHIELEEYDTTLVGRRRYKDTWSKENYFETAAAEKEEEVSLQEKIDYIYYKLQGVIK